MGIRRALTAALVAAALAGSGVVGAATAEAASPAVSWNDCTSTGGYVVPWGPGTYMCNGGKYGGAPITSM
ncbi:hypothetical protein ABZX30_05930 [Streptomyces sp. NPDC004542]|uniref:hypothetical protein n=1 Tax=Streptomyces sp. NPDC004542 TaxID=3154281 RepID=UPI0033B022E2